MHRLSQASAAVNIQYGYAPALRFPGCVSARAQFRFNMATRMEPCFYPLKAAKMRGDGEVRTASSLNGGMRVSEPSGSAHIRELFRGVLRSFR